MPKRQMNSRLGIMRNVSHAISVFPGLRNPRLMQSQMAPITNDTIPTRTIDSDHSKSQKKRAPRTGSSRRSSSKRGIKAVCIAPSPNTLRSRCANRKATSKAAILLCVPKAKARAISRSIPVIRLRAVPERNREAECRIERVVSDIMLCILSELSGRGKGFCGVML